MRRNLKRVASLILSTLVVAQLIPTLAFAASDPASPLVKEPGYGQNDMNFGVASVYLDDTLVGTVDLNGHMNAKVLLFEKTGLSTGTHTIRVFCDSPIIDIDYFAVAL